MVVEVENSGLVWIIEGRVETTGKRLNHESERDWTSGRDKKRPEPYCQALSDLQILPRWTVPGLGFCGLPVVDQNFIFNPFIPHSSWCSALCCQL